MIKKLPTFVIVTILPSEPPTKPVNFKTQRGFILICKALLGYKSFQPLKVKLFTEYELSPDVDTLIDPNSRAPIH